MTSALKGELKKWLNQLAADERKSPARYHDSGMLFRLPNGLAVEPVLVRKKFLKWQDGGGSVKKNGLYDSIVTIAKNSGIKLFELSGVEPNPRHSKEGYTRVATSLYGMVVPTATSPCI